MMTRERYARRNTPCGRGRAGYVTESLYRSPTETHHAMKCRQSEGLLSTQKGSPGQVIANTQKDRKMAGQSKVVVKAAQNWRVANAGPRPISISSWRNSPAWVPSADCIRGARPRFPICRTPWLNCTVGMGAD